MKLALNRKLFILSTFALFIFSSLTITDVLANSNPDPDDTVDGVLTTQNFNNEAKVTNFDMVLGNDSAFDGSAAAMDPFTEYRMKVTVLDPDTIRDLRSVELAFYYSVETDNATFESNFVSANHETDTDGAAFVVRWENDPVDNDPDSPDTNFTVQYASNVTSGGVTWELIEVTSDVPTTTTELNRTSFVYVVHFKVSKVATQSTDSWYVGATLEDGRTSLDNDLRGSQNPKTLYPALLEDTTQIDVESDTTFDLSAHSTAFDMNFYGEIVKPQDTVSVAWDNVPAGITFGAIAAGSQSTIEDITFISNGLYQTQIKSSEDWDAMMTSALADVLFTDVTSSEWDAFDSALTTIGVTPLGSGNLNLQEFKNLNLTFAQVNTVAIAASSTNNFWDTFMGPNDSLGILLPESSTGVNRTGAKIVTSSATFATLSSEEQFFAIGYKLGSIDSSAPVRTPATSGGDYDNYYLVGDDFRSIQEEIGFDRTQTVENGHLVDFELYLALSATFQNARYQGTITLKIVNQ